MLSSHLDLGCFSVQHEMIKIDGFIHIYGSLQALTGKFQFYSQWFLWVALAGLYLVSCF